MENSHTTAEAVQADFDDPFLERVRKLTETKGSALRDLYEKKGGEDPAFQDALDDVVTDVAFSDETYADNAAKLKNPRLNPVEAERVMNEQRATFDEIRNKVIVEAGLPTEELRSDIAKTRQKVSEQLDGLSEDDLSSDQILRKLGILRETEDGAVFAYPETLFPNSVNEKWENYLATVTNHIAKTKELNKGHGSEADVEDADRIRRFAHNRITEDVHTILGFDKLPKEKWELEDTRRMVAKMRDSKFVERPTRESELTAQMMRRSLRTLGIIGKLAERK